MKTALKCQVMTVVSHKDQRQQPCYVQKLWHSPKLATTTNKKKNEA